MRGAVAVSICFVTVFFPICICDDKIPPPPEPNINTDDYHQYKDTFEETLKIRSLPSGNIYTYFEFIINDAGLSNHTRFFPRALSDILIHHSVHELHFSLTQGHWRTEFWGDVILPAPGGAQVVAWFTADNNEKAGENWKGLTSRLSGLTCASLNFLEDRNSIAPHFGYRPVGNPASVKNSSPLFVRVGSLPKENACTENLTPWTKLLPCGVLRGLASLVRSKQVFNTHYHSAGIQFTKSQSGVQLKLTLSLVFDSPKQGKYRPSDNFARRLFGPVALFPCHPSRKTSVQLWSNGTWKEIDPKNLNTLKISDIPAGDSSDLKLIFTPVKYLGGYGQADGEIIVEMTNHLDVQLPVLYMEVLPWYIRPYLHTMKTEVRPPGTKLLSEPGGRLFHYTPGRDRQVLHKLEMDFLLPPKSTVRLSFMVEKRHLRWDEYPPDANHGFYLEPSRFEVNYTKPDSAVDTIYYYSRKLLVNLSTPDFSMPYNVICLTCTVVALAFGPLHNITTKSLKLTPKDNKDKLSHKLLARVKGVWYKVRGRKAETTEVDPVPAQEPTDEVDLSPLPAGTTGAESSPSPQTSSKRKWWS